jgi:hypothetical protein
MLVRLKDQPDLAKPMYNWLADFVGIQIRILKKTADNAEDFYQSIASHNFAGAEAIAMLETYQQGMDMCYTEDKRKTNRNLRLNYKKYCSVWAYFKDEVWAVIVDTSLEREIKARRVEIAGAEMCRLWRVAFGASSVQYLHYLAAHLPKQIRTFTTDIYHLQIQGLEHNNKLRKQMATAKLVNFHKPGKQGLSTVTEYKHHKTGTLCKVKEKKDVDGNVTRAAGLRSSGTCMAYQMMHISALMDYVAREKANGKTTAVEFAKIRRQLRLKKEANRRTLRAEEYDSSTT